MLAYQFTCIQCSYTLLTDVDYLLRMHASLVRHYGIIVNTISLAGRSTWSFAYKGIPGCIPLIRVNIPLKKPVALYYL